MAIVTEGINLVKQKVREASRGPAIGLQLKGFWKYMAEHKSNPDLQFVPINDLGTDAVVADAACKIYVIYLKKGATASTAAFVKGSDHATAASATVAEFVQEMNLLNQEFLSVYPDGWSQGTGFTIGSDTAADGSTESTSGHGPNGFIILGAA